jgi:serine/threonine protein kinase
MNIQNLSGQFVGQYQIRAFLGMGGMGAVYRAYQANLKREVAIKILLPLYASQPGYAERFVREAQTAASLEHTHIVPIFDYGSVSGITYVAMRLLSGSTLAERLTEQNASGQPLPAPVESSDILKQLASALDYAHSKGVIHRDIKASNVMFDNQGSAFLVDFGIAKLLDGTTGLTGTGVAMGTPSYMSPEQWRGDEVTPAADQYALGVLVYAMLTGKLPFEAGTPYAMMHKHLHETPLPPQTLRTELPEAVQIVLERAMAKEVEARFPTATAFAQAFEKAISGIGGTPTGFFKKPLPPKADIPTPPFPMSNTGTQAHPKWYNRPVAWVGGLLTLLLIVAGVMLLSNGSQSPATPTATESNSQVQIAVNASDTPLAFQIVSPEIPSETPLSPTPSFTPTDLATETASNTPSHTPTDTATATPTQTETPDTIAIAQATYSWIQTLTATQWTPTPSPTITPTPNATQTFDAAMTALFGGDLTLTAISLTLTANSWTPTFTPTPTPTDTATPTLTFTPIPLSSSTNGDPLLAPVRNSDWIPQSQSFNGVAMMLVPVGCFVMGSDTGSDNERPVHEQCFSQPFWIDYTEVTNGQYGSSGGFSGENLPREDVTYFEAKAFCESRGARLPTEAEWEYAARGPESLVYPWGNTWIASNVVYRDGSNSQTSPVGSRPDGVSWVGALDMSGNVWEWTASIHKPYPYNPTDGRENDNDVSNYRVIKGGSWDFGNENTSRAARRDGDGYALTAHDNGIGFRCARGYAESSDANTVAQITESQIAFRTNRDGNWEIYKMNEDGSNPINLTNNIGDDQFPSWSLDGRQIVFVSNRDGNDEIYVMNADGSNPHNVSNHRELDTVPVWSPDGERIAFVSARSGNWEVYSMTADGGDVRNLTNNDNEDFTPSWSPDGGRIVFHSNRGGNFEIYAMDANGANVSQLTSNPSSDFGATWSPDGGRIAFYSSRDGDSEIFVMNADGSNVMQLTSNSDNDSGNNSDDDVNPHWSPDGRRIVFSSRRDGNVEVYIMNSDGTGQRPLTTNEANDSSASWQPIQS